MFVGKAGRGKKGVFWDVESSGCPVWDVEKLRGKRVFIGMWKIIEGNREFFLGGMWKILDGNREFFGGMWKILEGNRENFLGCRKS